MLITRLKLKNWRNFKKVDVKLRERVYVIGPNASGKSNLLDVMRFLRDVAKPEGGGLQKAIKDRGGIKKLRCLLARKDPEISIEVELAERVDADPVWRYTLAFKSEGKGQQRPSVSMEKIENLRTGKTPLDRPNNSKEDRNDPDRLTQTHIEQINTNREFREVADFFAAVTYLHLVPQLLKHADQLGGYTLLGADWRAALRDWQAAGHTSPPVILTVCNRTETAARIEHYFQRGDAHWPEMHAPTKTLRVDSKVLEKAEVGETAASDKDYEAALHAIVDATNIPEPRKERLRAMKKEELLREIVDNVGKRGTGGQDLQNVISVQMLSEGWDAKNVTHIMGLRAFTSQLLCEQVIGRGLRRVGYDTDENGLFLPEYVNIFGVPLSIFQDVGEGGDTPPPPKPSTQIESLAERNELEVRWPNVLRIDCVVRPVLAVDWNKVDPLTLDPAQTPISAEIAPALGGATDWNKVHVIDLEKLPDEFRLQRITFKAARKAFETLEGRFTGTREYLVFQMIRLVEQFFDSRKLDIPSLFHQEPLRKRILIALNIDIVVQHLLRFVVEQNQERIEPVFDEEFPIGSTRYMRTWYSTKPCLPTRRSQISHMIADSSWEQYAANLFDSIKQKSVVAYVKNDHLGFQIYYLWNGSRKRFVPDFLIRLANGKILVLEIKGEDSEQNRAKRSALDAWVKGVNAKGGFGAWCWDVAFKEAQIHDIIDKHAK